ncbi:MAG: S8 family serine peptidase [Candidatus Omnitrophica bacterium]|nr:S8 family serine peptidase [Candidatus Omnitrophota bacterium]
MGWLAAVAALAWPASAMALATRAQDAGATAERFPRVRTVTIAREEQHGSPQQSLSPQSVPYAPGQVIVKFKSRGEHALTACAHCLLARRQRFAAVLADASDSVDRLNQRCRVTSASSLFVERHGLSALQAQANEQRRLARITRQFSRRAARAAPGESLPDLTNIYLLAVPADSDVEQICRLYRADPHVEYAEPNYRRQIALVPNDPYYSSSGSWGQPYADLWGLKKLRTAQAWDTAQGEGIVVAVVDTGTDYTHDDLAANIWTNPQEVPANGVDDDANGYVDDVRGWDFVSDENDPLDDHGHGTHVAGTIAAVGENHAGIIGVAWRSHIMSLKGLDAWGVGWDSWLANALFYAARNGADVINNSWGGWGQSALLEDAVRYAHGVGAVVIAAAGNSDSDVSGFMPANLADVITVAASDQNDGKCDFSNFGVKVDVAAPGCGTASAPPGVEPARNILSLAATTCQAVMCDPSLRVGEGYLRQMGTSMAAPHAAGVAALVLSNHPAFSNEEVRQVLRASANDVGASGFDTASGYGRLNAFRALQTSSVCVARITAPRSNDLKRREAIDVRGTASCPSFARYDIEDAPSPTGPWNARGFSGTVQVFDGLLASWTPPEASAATYYVRLTVTDPAGRAFRDVIGPIVVDPTLHPGWPQTVAPVATERSPFALADVDGNGTMELIVADLAGMLHVFSASGAELPGWPVAAGVTAISDVIAADVDADRDLELFFVGDDERLYGYQHTGVGLPGWPQTLSSGTSDSYALVAADVDRDGAQELVVMPTWPKFIAPHSVSIYRGDGSLVRQWPLYDVWNTMIDFGTGPAVADLNGDGIPELIASLIDTRDTFYYLAVFDLNGALLQRMRLEGITAGIERNDEGIGFSVVVDSNRPVVGDLDADGDAELVISRSYRNTVHNSLAKLFVWSYDEGLYTPLAHGDTGTGLASGLALGDLDRNGDREILFAANELAPGGHYYIFTHLYAFEPNGVLLQRSEDAVTTTYFQASPLVADVDGDGTVDVHLIDGGILQATPTTNVYRFSQSGAITRRYELPNQVFWSNFAPPMVADLDGDKQTELVALQPETGMIAVFDIPGAFAPSRMDWPQFQHDAQHTGAYVPPAGSGGGNLLSNGGFESGQAYWLGWGFKKRLTTDTVFRGAQAAEITLRRRVMRLKHVPLPIVPGTRYTVRAALKTDDITAGEAYVQVQWLNGAGLILQSDTFGQTRGTTNWQMRSSGSLTAPADATQVRVSLMTDPGRGSAYFDAVTLRASNKKPPG